MLLQLPGVSSLNQASSAGLHLRFCVQHDAYGPAGHGVDPVDPVSAAGR